MELSTIYHTIEARKEKEYYRGYDQAKRNEANWSFTNGFRKGYEQALQDLAKVLEISPEEERRNTYEDEDDFTNIFDKIRPIDKSAAIALNEFEEDGPSLLGDLLKQKTEEEE